MASSDPSVGLAQEEATRVALQSHNLWGALKRPLGDRFEAEYEKVTEQAHAQVASSVLFQTSEAARQLAFHHHLIQCAQDLQQGLVEQATHF